VLPVTSARPKSVMRTSPLPSSITLAGLRSRCRPAVGVADVVDAAHVLVGNLAGETHFVVELRQTPRIAFQGFPKELHRDRPFRLQVVGAIDLSPPALAEATDDPVALDEDRSGLEPPLGAAGR
jgi:hypothetical protein